MQKKNVLMLAAFIISTINVTTHAQRQLDRNEILSLFKQITDQPRKTWITAGEIKGEHIQYRAAKLTHESEINSIISQRISEYLANPNKPERADYLQKMHLDAIPFNTRYELANEYTMNSSESVLFDGQRFYWRINIHSRTDQVKPDKSLVHNEMTNQFNMEYNKERSFVWDGENYKLYTPSADHAFVDAGSRFPRVVNGPLTAGIIPWGHSRYSYDKLVVMQSEGLETTNGGKTEIALTLRDSNGSETEMVLDPAMNYAVLSCSIKGLGSQIISQDYSNYQNISGQWVPKTITLSRHDADSQRLLARDIWTITSIDTSVPAKSSFVVNYKEDTLVEYASPASDRSVMYHHATSIDTDALLAEKLRYDAAIDTSPRNCAMAALKYAFGQLDVSVSDTELTDLVVGPDRQTNLYEMKQFAENQGLQCRAIKTDLNTLRNLSNCQVILYLPGKKHFVVLAQMGTDFVRIVDLASRKFCYRATTDFFPMDWSTGVALVLSQTKIRGDLNDISQQEQVDISGAGGWTCSYLLQSFNVVNCTYVGGLCTGNYWIYWERYGCISAESGSCSSLWLWRVSTAACINDPAPGIDCTTDGNWTHSWIYACQ